MQHPAASQLVGLPDPGRVRRRVCGFHLGQGLGSSRTRGLWRGTLFLNPHIPWYRKSNPVNPSGPRSAAGSSNRKYARQDSNLQPSVPKTDALSN